ncbi:PREDICTED: protein S100-A10-like [Hipposideros armiger]|uniref:Protein S100-A10 n=1 Tax=Hipposideros armiger TaxID=186990 RepID=A0A8B7QLH7_HIPAR|nr:PREDICTED: protein S100-A10-like [Hipposideros armiger]
MSQQSDPASGQDLAQIPPQMECAMETMMFTFHKFAEDKGYLTKVLSGKKELPGFLENQKDPLAVEKIVKDVDQCCIGRAGFQSFSLIAGLTITYNDYFVIHKKCRRERSRQHGAITPALRVLPMSRLRKSLCPTASSCIRI